MRTLLIATCSLFLGIGFIALCVCMVKWIKGDAPMKILKLPSEEELRARDKAAMRAFKKFTGGK